MLRPPEGYGAEAYKIMVVVGKQKAELSFLKSCKNWAALDETNRRVNFKTVKITYSNMKQLVIFLEVVETGTVIGD